MLQHQQSASLGLKIPSFQEPRKNATVARPIEAKINVNFHQEKRLT